MKNRRLETKRKSKSGFRALYARTAKFKQRASASAASADDMEGDVPNVGIGRALTVILVLHLIAIAAIYVGSQWKNSDDVASNSVQKDTEHVTKGITGSPADGDVSGAITLTPPPSDTDNNDASANAGPVADRPPLQVSPGRQPRVIRPRINPNKPGAGAVRLGSYKIKSGDTLYRIALRLKIKQAALLAMNPKVNPSKIRIGQLINIPLR